MTLKDKKNSNTIKIAPINGGTVFQPAPAQNISAPPKVQQKPVGSSNVGIGTDKDKEMDLSKMTYEQLKNIAFTASNKVNQIAAELKIMFLEREDVIDDLMRALVAGHHLLMLGPPGTGKSKLAEELTSRIISARIFKWLLNKTSTPEDIIGQISIKNMERDKYIRKLDGKLADCEIAFIDEIFKSNGPTLNSMLPVLNERIVYNDGKAVKVPLRMMIAASNETPEEDEGLEALYDRILIKHWLEYIKDPGNKQKMMSNYNDSKNPFSKNNNNGKTQVTLEEIEVLQYFKNAITPSKASVKAFGKLLTALGKRGVVTSDRKLNWCWDVMKANALLQSRVQVEEEDLVSIVYILWENKEDIEFLKQETAKLVNPSDMKINQLCREAKEEFDIVETLKDQDRKKATEQCIEMKSKVELILEKMSHTIKSAKVNGKKTDSYETKYNDIAKHAEELVYSVIGIKSSNPLGSIETAPF